MGVELRGTLRSGSRLTQVTTAYITETTRRACLCRQFQKVMSVLLILGQKCTLATSRAVSRVAYAPSALLPLETMSHALY